MTAKNILYICSDEHARDYMGIAGHNRVQTPALDALAARGTIFTNASCTTPICVPSRANLMTGRYSNDTGYWDNADPYDGKVPSWGHHLQDAGHHTVSIGKLHFRSADDANGFTEEIMPLHVHDGIGDPFGLVRDEIFERPACARMAADAGRGNSSYIDYDRDITKAAQSWLETQAKKHTDKPWTLFVSFVCPHFPLIAPPEYYDLYPEDQHAMPLLYDEQDRPRFPWLDTMRQTFNYDAYFDEKAVRRALSAYMGLISFLSDNIGKVLASLEAAGLADETRVIYASDHGDAQGKRGLWGKSTMYEEALGIPMIMAGPGVPKGKRVSTPVSLIDIYPTILATTGVTRDPSEPKIPGRSLLDIADGAEPKRVTFAEYHAAGSPEGAYAIRDERWKYHYYVGSGEFLFDLVLDPHETTNLATQERHQDTLKRLRAELFAICDPDETNRKAKARQAEIIDSHGGKEAIIERGCFGHSPTPSEEAIVDA